MQAQTILSATGARSAGGGSSGLDNIRNKYIRWRKFPGQPKTSLDHLPREGTPLTSLLDYFICYYPPRDVERNKSSEEVKATVQISDRRPPTSPQGKGRAVRSTGLAESPPPPELHNPKAHLAGGRGGRYPRGATWRHNPLGPSKTRGGRLTGRVRAEPHTALTGAGQITRGSEPR